MYPSNQKRGQATERENLNAKHWEKGTYTVLEVRNGEGKVKILLHAEVGEIGVRDHEGNKRRRHYR